MENRYNLFVNFAEWLNAKYVAWRGSAIGRNRSITAFGRWLGGVDKSTLNLMINGKRPPGELSKLRIGRRFPEMYDLFGFEKPDEEILQADEIPEDLRRRLKKAFRETKDEYLTRNIDLEDPEAERIAIEIFERNGFKYIKTENDD